MVDYGLISVIVPVYNAEKYLKQCVDSVLAQTYKNIEIILVDDGSSDSSGKICDEYVGKFPFIRTFHKENGGASSARNYGLREAKGTYLYFLDSDDWLVDSALEKMIVCAADNQAELVFIEAQTVDENGNEVKGKYDYHKHYSSGAPYLIMEEMMENKEFHVGTPFFFIKKEVFTKNGLQFKEGIMYEDMMMAYQLFSTATRCAHVHEYVYIRRYRANSVMTSAKTEKNYVSAATVYREVAAFMKTLPDSKQSPKHIIRCAFNLLNIYRQMSDEIKKKYKNDYNNIVKDILDNNAYGDKALKLDCKNHFLWFCYKASKKVFH